jgi:hypothetical protein
MPSLRKSRSLGQPIRDCVRKSGPPPVAQNRSLRFWTALRLTCVLGLVLLLALLQGYPLKRTKRGVGHAGMQPFFVRALSWDRVETSQGHNTARVYNLIMGFFRFYGHILPPPPTAKLTAKDLPSIHWEDKQLGLVMDVNMSIVDSEVIISCESNQYSTHEEISEVYKRVFDMARAAVDCFSYVKGWGLSIILERVVPPNGVEQMILVQRPELAKLVTAFNIDSTDPSNNFNAMYKIALSDPDVMLAVNDLIASIAVSHHGPINCGRVVEVIRDAIAPRSAKEKQAWEIMRTSLNLSFDYVQFITHVSKGPRHGKRMGVTTQDQFNETINRAWTVMNRFFEYKKRGDVALPIDLFPLLS